MTERDPANLLGLQEQLELERLQELEYLEADASAVGEAALAPRLSAEALSSRHLVGSSF